MHIKTLVLDNFKSFGRKTEIPFYDDFTTISGPNGAGKSNIIDAVLFALGLARSSGIRAEKLTDLIYNPGHLDGESDRGPSEASVEVILDNTDRTLSRDQVIAAAGTEKIGDHEEIAIRRRVKETDENYYSYYYLNERSVNLSDIQDLLSQAGVTPEGYNVVMQGDVTGIVSKTAYRRREIIDEIAGVAQFDAKKEDAFAELDVVTDRIDEAELRIEEKQSRLDRLKDEREAALEYKGLREEKAEFEGYLKAAELEEKQGDLASLRADLETRRGALADARSELAERRSRLTDIEANLDELNREIERKGEDEQLALQREIESIKGEIARLEGDIEAAEDRITSAEADRREAFVEVDHKQERFDDLEAEIRDVKLEKASVQADIQNKEAELSTIEAEIDEIGEEYEDLKADLDDGKAALDEVKNEKNELQREQDRLLDEARRRSNEQAEVSADLEAARDRLSDIEVKHEDLESERDKAQEKLGEIESVIDDLREQQAAVSEDLESVEEELRAKQQEYAELEAKAGETGDESWPRSVTAILNAEFDGVHGPIGQLGNVEEQYATACETAAGGRLANVVVDDDGVGQRCIEYLKDRNAGRATFLPISAMTERSLPPLPDREGVIDYAYNLVTFDNQYAGVFSYVLGATLVVDTLTTARALMGDYRLVTLSGDLVERSGAMTGGSTKGTRYSFAGGDGQLARLGKELEALQDERQGHREELNAIKERLDEARDRKADAVETVRDIEVHVERVERDRQETVDRIESLEDRLDEIDAERESVDAQMQEIEAEIGAQEEEIARIEETIDAIQAELADSRIPALSEEAEGIEAEIEALEDRRDNLAGRLNELQLEKEFTAESIDDLHDRIESAQNRRVEAEERIETLEEEIASKESELSEKREAVDDLEDELADLKADRESLRESLRDAESARDEQRETVTQLENRVESLESTVERLELEISELQDVVAEYDPDEIPAHDEVQATIDRLERAMERLEPVNMLAIDEYDEVDEDLTALEERKATLVEERDGIKERIVAYERQKKEAFMEAFEGIDEHFQDIFARLSGGTGELVLENPDDPFEAGLTMRAEPEDKPIQRLDAMSGGEKSLTALAFIFAIQRYNPAPFYAFDEIDAFLDAANAERVGEMLDELAENAQFIVVSHRSAMLERSERAIGVTMQDENISSVTGIAIAGESGREAHAAVGGDDD